MSLECFGPAIYYLQQDYGVDATSVSIYRLEVKYTAHNLTVGVKAYVPQGAVDGGIF